MTIALTRAPSRSGYRYLLGGELSKYANWSQTLDFPSDDNTLDLTGDDVRITFQNCNAYLGWDYGWYGWPSSSYVALSTTDGQITVTDADTITIAADTSDLSGLCDADYYVDIASKSGSDITHLAHGRVVVRSRPPSWP